MSKFGDDIRRISKYQELLDLIRQTGSDVNQSTKGAINGARGIAYGLDGAGTKGTPGVTLPNNNKATPVDSKVSTGTKEGEKEAVDSAKTAMNAGTKGGAGGDLGSLDNTDRDGWYDADSILQGVKDGFNKVPPVNNKVINAITGLVNAAGRKIIAHLRDAAISMIGPDDLADINQQVTDPTYIPGYYYVTVGAGPGGDLAYKEPTQQLIINDIIASWAQYLAPGRNPAVFDGWQTVPPSLSSHPVNAKIQDPTGNYLISVDVITCSTGGNIRACPIVPPYAAWTTLGATQLGWITAISPVTGPFFYSQMGRFMPHPYDSSVPPEFADGASILDLISAAGNTVRLGPLAAGGWYLYYRDAITGLPTGSVDSESVYTVHDDRTPGSFITPTALSKLLPQ